MEAAAQSAQLILNMRAEAKKVFLAGVRGSGPDKVVAAALLQKQEEIARAHRVVIVAFGRSACSMADAAINAVGDKLASAVVVTDYPNLRKVGRARTICAGYPAIDPGGVFAALEVESAISAAAPEDLVLVLISSGGPAMLCAPPFGISLASKIKLQDLLVQAGADVKEILTIRHATTRLNDGGLVLKAGYAKVLSLILSDPGGDELFALASGPTAQRKGGSELAIAILEKYSLVKDTDRAILDHIRGQQKPRGQHNSRVENLVVSCNAASLSAAGNQAAHHGKTLLATASLDEDPAVTAVELHKLALEVSGKEGPLALVWGRIGQEGRNEELALRYALIAESVPIRRPWVFLSGNTKKRTTPYSSSGALLDAGSCSWMRQLGIDPARQVVNGDAPSALAASGDLLLIDETAAEASDLALLVIA